MHSTNNPERVRVLLYLGNANMAERLAAFLATNEVTANAVHSFPALKNALLAGDVDVAVTQTSGIDVIRQLACVPVLNIEAFVFDTNRPEAKSGRQLDSRAFVNRIFEHSHRKISWPQRAECTPGNARPPVRTGLGRRAQAFLLPALIRLCGGSRRWAIGQLGGARRKAE